MRSANQSLPSPFPEGWYFVASRQSVQKAGLLQKTWMGESIVVWCDREGNVCVAESFCPHLGSDMGPETGGRVCEGRLVCPFHGFQYDTTGQCVATPFASPPRNARLRVFETRDIAGLIFAWWGIEGREPQWSLPDQEPDQAGWTGLEINTLRFPGHPQETTENSVDLAHLRYVHGYDSVTRIGSAFVDGPLLESDFDFRSRRTVGRFIPFTMDISARTRIFGLGYSYVEIREHSIGMNMRLWVLTTPVDGTLIDMSLASQVEEIRHTRRRASGLGMLPVRMRAPLVNKFVAAMQKHDVLQDVVIWRRKRYQSRPRLCRSDGEIMPFRAYCAQFYPDLNNVVDETRAAAEISST
ncbi:MAG: Rieske 2Fe-2S domain-containing protein [Chloroflexi bacterium]|nr:Rieske 2Fe-2S domain-containing protein [Chloroflexota bacterium]